jgi:hypothetical protein
MVEIFIVRLQNSSSPSSSLVCERFDGIAASGGTVLSDKEIHFHNSFSTYPTLSLGAATYSCVSGGRPLHDRQPLTAQRRLLHRPGIYRPQVSIYRIFSSLSQAVSGFVSVFGILTTKAKWPAKEENIKIVNIICVRNNALN